MCEGRNIILKRNLIVTNMGRVPGRRLMNEICLGIGRSKLLKLMELLELLKSTRIKAGLMIQ
jgi:hypothetical protein